MKQTVEFEYALGDSVRIIGPDYRGVVIEQQHSEEKQYFRVQFWSEGTRRVETFSRWELD